MMEHDGLTAAEQTIARVLDQLERLYEEAETTIANHPDSDQAFRFATEFALRVHAIHDKQEVKLRELRNDQAERIRKDKALSLAKLGERIGVSKSRADQMVRDAAERAGKEDEP